MFLLDRCSIQSKRIKVYYAQLIKIHSFAIKERNSWPRQSYLTTRLCVRNNYTPAPFVFLLLLLFTHFTSENIFYPLSRNAHIILNKASQFFALFSSRKCTRDQINSRFRKTETQGRGGSDEGRKKKRTGLNFVNRERYGLFALSFRPHADQSKFQNCSNACCNILNTFCDERDTGILFKSMIVAVSSWYSLKSNF